MHIHIPFDIEGHLVYKVIATLDSICLQLSAYTTLACVYHADHSSMGQRLMRKGGCSTLNWVAPSSTTAKTCFLGIEYCPVILPISSY